MEKKCKQENIFFFLVISLDMFTEAVYLAISLSLLIDSANQIVIANIAYCDL